MMKYEQLTHSIHLFALCMNTRYPFKIDTITTTAVFSHYAAYTTTFCYVQHLKVDS